MSNIITNNNSITRLPTNESYFKSHSEITLAATLPAGFTFKTLSIKHLNEINDLLSLNYIENFNGLTRLIYSKDLLYWYFKDISPGLIIGLMLGSRLVGMISAKIEKMILINEYADVAIINFLCVHKKLRSVGLCKLLIIEIKRQLDIINCKNIIYATQSNQDINTIPVMDTANSVANSAVKSVVPSLKIFTIPINYSKLIKLKLLQDDDQKIKLVEKNPLHLIVRQDLVQIIPKLNIFTSKNKFEICPYFTSDNAQHHILPKKNICYSFATKDSMGIINNFICVYQSYQYYSEINKLLSVATVGYYFNETLDLTKLIEYLIDKLHNYNFDQLNYYDMATTTESAINITKYFTETYQNYYLAEPSYMPNDKIFMFIF